MWWTLQTCSMKIKENRVSSKEPISKVIKHSKGRIIFTSFASNLGRLKIIAEAGERLGRSIVVMGRAMNNMLSKATAQAFLQIFQN